MRKVFCFVLALTLLVVIPSGFSASASEVSVYSLYTNSYSSTLTISGTTATCYSKLTGYRGTTTKIVISQTLQKKTSSGDWSNIASWNKTANTYVSSFTNTKTNLSSGTYRVKSVFTVYSGSKYETITLYSSTKTV